MADMTSGFPGKTLPNQYRYRLIVTTDYLENPYVRDWRDWVEVKRTDGTRLFV
jgi:hypothetical protein